MGLLRKLPVKMVSLMVPLIFALIQTSYQKGSNLPGLSRSGDYCSISKRHTMCLYKGPSASCAKKTMFGGFTEVGKQAILDKHNELRRKIAKGEEKGMPPAASSNTTNAETLLMELMLGRTEELKMSIMMSMERPRLMRMPANLCRLGMMKFAIQALTRQISNPLYHPMKPATLHKLFGQKLTKLDVVMCIIRMETGSGL